MIYETDQNEQEERQVAAYLSMVYGFAMYKTPQFAVVDYIATRDTKPIALVEIKCRRQSIQQIDEMGGYLISLSKWTKMRQLSDMMRMPVALCIRFDKAVYKYVTYEFGYDGTSKITRRDRGETEPAVIINVERFTRVR